MATKPVRIPSVLMAQSFINLRRRFIHPGFRNSKSAGRQRVLSTAVMHIAYAHMPPLTRTYLQSLRISRVGFTRTCLLITTEIYSPARPRLKQLHRLGVYNKNRRLFIFLRLDKLRFTFTFFLIIIFFFYLINFSFRFFFPY